MTQPEVQQLELTIYDFVIGLVVAFVDLRAEGIVAPELDTRNDAAAKAAYKHLRSIYGDDKLRFYIGLNDYRESQDWRECLHHFGSTLFRPEENHGVLYFQKGTIEHYTAKMNGPLEMWHDVANVFIMSYYSLAPQWTAWAESIGYPNFPYVIGADTNVFT